MALKELDFDPFGAEDVTEGGRLSPVDVDISGEIGQEMFEEDQEAYEDKYSTLDVVGHRLKGGAHAAYAGASAIKADYSAQYANAFDAIDQGKSPAQLRKERGFDSRIEKRSELDNAMDRYLQADDEERKKIRDFYQQSFSESVENIVEQRKEISEIPSAPVARRVIEEANKGNWGAAIESFAHSPLSFISQVGTESLPHMVPGLILTAVTRNPALGMGIGSFSSDYGSQLTQLMEEEGVNVNDMEALSEAFKNEELMASVRSKATKRALVVGGADALSGGIAGKMLAPAKMGKYGKHTTNVVAQTGVGGTLGAAGEAGGQLAAGQELKGGEIFAEAVGEAFQAPVEVFTALNTARKTPNGVREDKSQNPDPLTPEDEASPISNDDLAAGRAEMADVDATMTADQYLGEIGLPRVNTRVRVTMPGNAQSFGGVVQDAFKENESDWTPAPAMDNETGQEKQGFYNTKTGDWQENAPSSEVGIVLKMDNGETVKVFASDLANFGVSIMPERAAIPGKEESPPLALPAGDMEQRQLEAPAIIAGDETSGPTKYGMEERPAQIETTPIAGLLPAPDIQGTDQTSSDPIFLDREGRERPGAETTRFSMEPAQASADDVKRSVSGMPEGTRVTLKNLQQWTGLSKKEAVALRSELAQARLIERGPEGRSWIATATTELPDVASENEAAIQERQRESVPGYKEARDKKAEEVKSGYFSAPFGNVDRQSRILTRAASNLAKSLGKAIQTRVIGGEPRLYLKDATAEERSAIEAEVQRQTQLTIDRSERMKKADLSKKGSHDIHDFVKSQGGILPAEMGKEERERLGLKSLQHIRKQGGKTIPEMREAAEEAGFLPDGSYDSDFLSLLDQNANSGARVIKPDDIEQSLDEQAADIDPEAEAFDRDQATAAAIEEARQFSKEYDIPLKDVDIRKAADLIVGGEEVVYAMDAIVSQIENEAVEAALPVAKSETDIDIPFEWETVNEERRAEPEERSSTEESSQEAERAEQSQEPVRGEVPGRDGEGERSAGEKIRDAFPTSFTVRKTYPIKASHNGKEQSFLAYVKFAPKFGGYVIYLDQIRMGRLLSGDPLTPIVQSYKLSKSNVLSEVGYPSEARKVDVDKWLDSGLKLEGFKQETEDFTNKEIGEVLDVQESTKKGLDDKTKLDLKAKSPMRGKADQEGLTEGLFGTQDLFSQPERVQNNELDQETDFDPAQHVKIAADSIGQLRSQDVQRLFDRLPDDIDLWDDLRVYIIENRPDLTDQVVDALEEQPQRIDQVDRKALEEFSAETKRRVGLLKDALQQGNTAITPAAYGMSSKGGRATEYSRQEDIRFKNGTAQIREGNRFNSITPDVLNAMLASAGVNPEQKHEPASFDYSDTMTLEKYDEVRSRLLEGDITAEELKAAYSSLVDSEEGILSELQKMTIKQLGKYAGPRYSGEKKASVVRGALMGLQSRLHVGASLSYVMGTKHSEAVRKAVEKQTDADIQAYAERVKKQRADYDQRMQELKKSVENPETYEEFRQFIRLRGQDALSAEQQGRYDELRAEQNRKKDEAEKERKSKVTAKAAEGVSMELVEGKHTKKGHDIFTVKLSGERLEKDAFSELRNAAKKLGGYYSSYRGGGAVPGFVFKDKSSAENFMSLRDGSEVVSDKIEKKDAKRSETAVSKLREMADKIEAKAEESLNADRRENTARQAAQAASSRDNAQREIAMAKTMRNIADAVESGDAKNLGKVQNKTHIETLNSFARRAMFNSLSNESLKAREEGRRFNREDEEAKGPQPEQMTEAKLPLHGRDWSDIYHPLRRVEPKAGHKRDLTSAERLAGKGEKFNVNSRRHMEIMQSLVAGYGDDFKYTMILDDVSDFKRLQKMGIYDLPSFRAALREYLTFSVGKKQESKLSKMERDLIGSKIAGFFPTPKPLIDNMIEEIGITKGMDVLEPEAGKGDIADALKDKGVNVDVAEVNGTLVEILEEKGHSVVARDMMQLDPSVKQYDRIIMNPPFEKYQDVEHVQHAYDLLKPGGKMAAIMSAGPFQNSQKKAVDFRLWLDGLSHTAEKNQEGSFKGSDSFRQTGVSTYTVTIEKDLDTPSFKRGDGGLTDDQFEAARREVESTIRKMAPNVEGLQIRDDYIVIDGKIAGGGYSSLEDVIGIVAGQPDAIRDTLHEIVHHLFETGRLSKTDQSVLRKRAKKWRKNHDIDERYREFYESKISDRETVEYWLDQEAIAEEFSGRLTEEKATGPLKKLQDWLRKVRASIIRALGKDNAETLFEDIRTGKVGRRFGSKKEAQGIEAPSLRRERGTDTQEGIMRSKMSIDPRGVKDAFKETVTDLVDGFRDGIYQKAIDQFDSISKYERNLNDGDLKRASSSAYKMARLTQNLHSVMGAVLHHGPLEYRDGGYRTMEGFEGGFMGIFKDITDRGELALWQGYAAAKRAEELMGQDRENLFTEQDIAELLDHPAERLARFEAASQKLADFNSKMLDMAEASGIIDGDQREVWQSDNYVPFYRLMEDPDSVSGPMNKKGIANQRSGIRKLEGGEQKLENLIENMVLNMTHMVDASMKNEAAKRTVAMMAEGGLMGTDGAPLQPVTGMDWQVSHVTPEQAASELENIGVQVEGLTPEQHATMLKFFTPRPTKDQDVISVMINGKPKYYKVNDPLLLASLTSMGDEKMHWLVRMLGYPKRWLTYGVTSLPGFMVANGIRDSLHAWVLTGGKVLPFYDAARGIKKSFMEETSVISIMAAGGGSGGYYRTEPGDINKHMTGQMNKGFSRRGLIDTPRKALEVWRKIGQATENANRIAIYEKVLEETGDQAEAAFQAMDIMDFSRRGSSTVMRFFIGTVPFLNARIQGLDRLARGIKRPEEIGTTRRKILAYGMVLSGMTLALMADNSDDERYKDLPDWDKDMNYHIFLDHYMSKAALEEAGLPSHIRVPKPFELGAIFSTIPERAMALAMGNDKSKDTAKAVLNMFQHTFAVDAPQFAKPVIEQMRNRVSFTGGSIVPMRLERRSPEAQYDARTSEVAKGVGSALGASPKRIDALARGYFGNLGNYLIHAPDAMIRAATGGPEKPTMRTDELPEIGRFFRDEPAKTSKWVQEFYDTKREVEAIYNTVKGYQKEGRTGAAMETIEENKRKFSAVKFIRKQGKIVSNINARIRQIEDSAKMTGKEKRIAIDKEYERRNRIVKRAMKQYSKIMEQ